MANVPLFCSELLALTSTLPLPVILPPSFTTLPPTAINPLANATGATEATETVAPVLALLGVTGLVEPLVVPPVSPPAPVVGA